MHRYSRPSWAETPTLRPSWWPKRRQISCSIAPSARPRHTIRRRQTEYKADNPMALEHIKTWRIGEVEVTRIVEVWNREDPLSMLLEDGTPAMMLAYPWLHPHHATPAGDLLVNFQGFAIKAGRRRIIVDTCIGA